MKKSILFIGAVLAIIALMAVAFQTETKEVPKRSAKQISSAISFDDDFVDFMNESKIPNIIFNIDSRFIWEITKEDVHGALNFDDLLPLDAFEGVSAINETRVTLIEEDDEVIEWGSGMSLNDEQQILLKNMDYSTNFYVEAYCSYEDGTARKVVYFLSIVPENQTTYEEGIEKLISYLKKESQTTTSNIEQDKLKPGRIIFTINEEGKVTNLEKSSTSGYDKFDDKMFEAMENLPSGWRPATDVLGKPVEQTLVLFFGTQGC